MSQFLRETVPCSGSSYDESPQILTNQTIFRSFFYVVTRTRCGLHAIVVGLYAERLLSVGEWQADSWSALSTRHIRDAWRSRRKLFTSKFLQLQLIEWSTSPNPFCTGELSLPCARSMVDRWPHTHTRGYTARCANSTFHPSRASKWVVIHIVMWIMGMESVKTAGLGYVRLYGCRPKSVSAGLVCGERRPCLWCTALMKWHVRLAALCKWTLPLPFLARLAERKAFCATE